jgi:hypothetical protein
MKHALLEALRLTFAGVVVAWLVLSGCAETKEYAGAGKTAVIDCVKADLPAIAIMLASWGAKSALAGKIDWAAIESDAIARSKPVAACAVAEFLIAIKRQPTPEVGDTVAARALIPPVDIVRQGEAVLARISAGAEVRPVSR